MLGFPCNQFGAQEPGTDAEIAEFASSTYDTNFQLFSKVEVNGDGACELYRRLTAAIPQADGEQAVAWNFTKFLVGRDGVVLRRFEPMTTPQDIGEMLTEFL